MLNPVSCVEHWKPVNELPLAHCVGYKFKLQSAQEILDNSVMAPTETIMTTKLIDHGRPIERGLHDLRMGSCDDKNICMTCGGGKNGGREYSCPGHFAHTYLPVPCINTTFLKEIAQAMNCICFQCGEFYLDVMKQAIAQCQDSSEWTPNTFRIQADLYKLEHAKETGCARIRLFSDVISKHISAGFICPRCNCTGRVWSDHTPWLCYTRPSVSMQLIKPPLVSKQVTQKRRPAAAKKMSAERFIERDVKRIYSILQAVNPNVWSMVGFGVSPVNMIFTVLPIAANLARPYISMSKSNALKINDHTRLLQNIVIVSNWYYERVAELRNAQQEDKIDNDQELTRCGILLQGCITYLLNGSKSAGELVDLCNALAQMSPGRDLIRKSPVFDDLATVVPPHSNSIRKTMMSKKPSSIAIALRAPPLVCIMATIRGKEKLLRNVIIATRCGHNTRNVIEPETIPYHSISIPSKVSKTCTIAERACDINRDDLSRLIQNGPIADDGAERIHVEDHFNDQGIHETYTIALTADQTVKERTQLLQHHKIVTTNTTRTGRLQTMLSKRNVVIERHLRPGDLVLYGRHPTLHRASIQARMVQKVEQNSNVLRHHPDTNTPMNGDYDGDEQNMQVCHSDMVKAELMILQHPRETLTDDAGGKIFYGLVQWQIMGAAHLTFADTLLTRDEMIFYITVAQLKITDHHLIPNQDTYQVPWVQFRPELLPCPAVLFPEERWSGRQLFSLLTPACFKEEELPENDTSRCITDYQFLYRNGHLYIGSLTKDTIGISKNALGIKINQLWGGDVTLDWLYRFGTVALEYVYQIGLCLRRQDFMQPECLLNEIGLAVKEEMAEAERMYNRIIETKSKKYLCVPNMLPAQGEASLVCLRRARDRAGALTTKHLAKDNMFVCAIQTGVRGSMINVTQTLSCLGPQQISNRLYDGGFRERSSVHVPRLSASFRSRGMITSSINGGLDPDALVAQAAAGREGTVLTSTQTSTSGQMQRQLAYGLMPVTLQYNRSVTSGGRASKHVITRTYGYDGIDCQKLSSLSLASFLWSSDQVIRDKMSYTDLCQEHDNVDRQALSEWTDWLLTNRRALQQYQLSHNNGHMESKVAVAIDPLQFLDKVKLFESKHANKNEECASVAEFWMVMNKAIALMKKLASAPVSIFLQECVFKWYMRPSEWKPMKRSSMYSFWRLVTRQYVGSLAHPLQPVGYVSASSLSEPWTQATQNLSKQTGMESKHISGVQRGMQIIHDKPSHKTNIFVETPLVHPFDKQPRTVQHLARVLQCRVLADVLSSIKLVDTQVVQNSQLTDDESRRFEQEDKEWIQRFMRNKIPLQYTTLCLEHLLRQRTGSKNGMQVDEDEEETTMKKGSRKNDFADRLYNYLGVDDAEYTRMFGGEYVDKPPSKKVPAHTSREQTIPFDQWVYHPSGLSIPKNIKPSSFSMLPPPNVIERPGEWSRYVVRIVLDIEQCIRAQHTPATLADVIYQVYGKDVQIIHSAACDYQWILRIRPFIDKDLCQSAPVVLVNNVASIVGQHAYEMEAEYRLMMAFSKDLINKTIVSGCPEIVKAIPDRRPIVRIDPVTGQGKQEEEWRLVLHGKNVTSVVGQMWFVRQHDIFISDPPAVRELYGIVGQYGYIIRELQRPLEDVGVFLCHRELVAAAMTSHGKIRPFTKSGIQPMLGSSISSAFFEDPATPIKKASVVANMESLYGEFDAILTGGKLSSGTDAVQLISAPKPPGIEYITDKNQRQDGVGSEHFNNVHIRANSLHKANDPYIVLPNNDMFAQQTTSDQQDEYTGSWSPVRILDTSYKPTNPFNPTNTIPDQPSSPKLYTTYSATSPSYRPSSPLYQPNSPNPYQMEPNPSNQMDLDVHHEMEPMDVDPCPYHINSPRYEPSSPRTYPME